MTDAASLTDVRLVLAIEDTGSIGGAATLLRISQPSASQRLAVLERRVGVALVERDTTGARLTPAGQLFAEHGGRHWTWWPKLSPRPLARGAAAHGRHHRKPRAGRLPGTAAPLRQPCGRAPHRPRTPSRPRRRRRCSGRGSGRSEPGRVPGARRRRTMLGRDPVVLVGDGDTSASRRRPLAGLRSPSPPTTTSPPPSRTKWRAGAASRCEPRPQPPRSPWPAAPGGSRPCPALRSLHTGCWMPAHPTRGSPSRVASGW